MGLNDAYDVATNEVLSGHDPTEMMARVFGHVHDSENCMAMHYKLIK